jgi:RHS repeat-associated protein
MIAHKQPEGLESFYEYDEYSPKGKVQKSWTSRDEEWTFEYEELKTTVTNHLGEKDTFEYDEDDYLILRGNEHEEMKFEYTDKGLLKKLTNQFDQTKELRYNDYGQPTLIKEFDDIITRIYYDKKKQVPRKIRDGLDNSTYLLHNENNELIQTISPNGAKTEYSYNKQGEVVSITNPLKGKTTLEYDTHGNLVKKTDAKNNSTSYSYTREQQLKQRTNALNQSSTLNYDELGKVTSYTNPSHQRTNYFYDKLDRVTSTRDAINNELNYKYNNKAQLQAIIDPTENQTQYTYDKYGRVEKEQLPNEKEIAKVYNKDHTLKSILRVDKSELNFKYNKFKKPIEIEAEEINSTLSLTFEYNEVGRLSSANNVNAKVELFYNKIGVLNKEVQFDDISIETNNNAKTSTKTLKYLNLSSTVHNDFETQTKTISKNSHSKPLTIEYDKNGVETKISYPNGLEESYTFDESYNLINIQTGKDNFHYAYNANGEITAKNATYYTYDAIGRLIKAGRTSFEYDKAGNNLTRQSQYDKETNRLLENQSHLFIYDGRGNLVQKRAKHAELESTEYTFNALNQLISLDITQKGRRVKSFNYEYDALGRRVSKQSYIAKNSHETIRHYYLYDKQNIIAILDHNKTTVATITHHDTKIDTPLSITTLYGTFYFHRDHQGSIVALSDEYGDVVEEIKYDEHYGRIIKHTKRSDVETLNPYGYTGREIETNDLYYYRARYYDAGTQRFISVDPIGFMSGDFNFYRYVGNNVVNFRDPFGLTATCPISPPKLGKDWNAYYGDPDWFHCGFEQGFLENRDPTPEDPMAECFYDDKNILVDEKHPYSLCGGTPDQYGKDDPLLHTIWDEGGIIMAGAPAAYETARKNVLETYETAKENVSKYWDSL